MAIGRALARIEPAAVGAMLALMALLPLAEIVARAVFGGGIPGLQPVVQHLTLWVAFLGAALAAREDRLLALATGDFLPRGRWRETARALAAAVGAAAAALLARAGFELVLVEREFGTGGLTLLGLPGLPRLPLWLAQAVLPLAFVLIALRLVWRAGRTGEVAEATRADAEVRGDAGHTADVPPARWPRIAAAAGLAVGLFLGQWPQLLDGHPVWPALLLLVCGMIAGTPLFAVLGGAAALLFMSDGVPLAAVPAETYRLAVSPTLPAIPLFTLTGFLLAEGRASHRLLDVFRALVGWLPGGTAVVAAVVCAFFTIFTGGSGVTILALGALLFQALSADRYRERFSIGLLTASGSLGLLLPPALPLILYGIVAEVSIEDLFLGGLVPGLLLILLIAAWGMREGLITGARRVPFDGAALGRALWRGKWELLLPVFLLVAIFGGFATLVEAAALSAIYAFAVQAFIHRELSPRRDLPRVLARCAVLIGGVLIILGVAMGLTSYLVDAQVPSRLLEQVTAHIESPLVFLLALNLFLLLVGCLMDIFSAIVVVAPLIVPLGLAFGIDPVHLGIIFVANLELGYLTPPVGLNLFLASYRFERPLLEVYRAALPMLAILGFGVLLITYLPVLTVGVLRLLGRGG